MKFEAVGVDVEQRIVKVKYGELFLTCKIIKTEDGQPYVIKPKNVFVNREAFQDFLTIIRQAWQKFSTGDTNSE